MDVDVVSITTYTQLCSLQSKLEFGFLQKLTTCQMPSDTRLRYLFEAYNLGTMRAASEKLDVATSSISRQLAELEKELGVALIERGRRRIRLTEAGHVACEYFRQKHMHEEEFLAKIEDLRNLRAGKINMAVGEAFITNEFTDLLRKFMKKYPNLFVQVKVTETKNVIACVREDEAHFGLIFDLPGDPKIRARLTLEQPLKILVHPKHELTKIKDPKLEHLKNFDVALPEESFRIRQVIHAAEQKDGIFLKPILVTNSTVLLKDFAKSGRGITILPEFLAQPEISLGELTAIPIANPMLSGTKSTLVTRVGRTLPTGAHWLMSNIVSHLKSVSSVC